MNSVTNNAFRSAFSNAFRRLHFRTPAFYSTTAENAAESPAGEMENMPDTLYKTIEFEMRGYEPATIQSYSKFTTMAAEKLGIKIGKCWSPRKPIIDRNGLTVLRSRFVHKNHREQYEVRTYYKYANFHHLTGSTADTFLEYAQRNLPEGVGLKITKVAIDKLPSEVFSKPEPMDGEVATEETQNK